ncbi:hypothetical protein [Paracidovorax valerianellae]|uniref:hypothetical protein n=1 Tax=Paracidovorax valerianellae TaxID=187868 RepID=UPI002303ED32|nr:hypothetical protein [Paracidovorax valerianellae]MDA8444766.1 hypothetical protein [Paracidovorax valerianellae]
MVDTFRQLGSPVDERTDALHLPLPHLLNDSRDDVQRLRAALTLIDAAHFLLDSTKADAATVALALAGKVGTAQHEALANVVGTKLAADFSGLPAAQALDGLERLALNKAGAAAGATVADLMAWLRSKDGSWAQAQKFLAGLQTQSVNGGPLSGMRNRLINGKADHAQRGTSFPGTTVATGVYPVDRFTFTGSATPAVVTAEQAVDGPAAAPGLRRSARITVTTADAAMSPGESAGLQQAIEGYNIADLFGTTFTLSFFVRSAKVGTHCIAFFNAALDKSFVAEYTVAAANTWEYKTLTVTGGLPSAGGWNLSNGMGLCVRWSIAAGSTYHTQAGAWRDGLYLATAAQVNCLDAAGNVFALTGAQLEVGPADTRFEHRHEMELVKRYFEQFNNANGYAYSTGMVPSSTQVWAPLAYTEKRAAPTLLFPGSIPNYQFQIGGGTASCTERPFASSAGSKSAFLILPSTSAGLATDSKACLCLLSGDARINVSAELGA